MRKRLIHLGVSISAVLLLGASGAVQAVAAESESPKTAAIEAIRLIAPEVLEGLPRTEQSADSTASYSSEHTTVSVPRTSHEPIKLEGFGRAVHLTLPFAGSASADTTSDFPAFDNGNGSTTVALVRDDGSVQVLTVIDEKAAPTEYAYEIAAPGGGRLEALDNGAVIIWDGTGEFAGVIAPAWARDAKGVEVPTRYEINGTTLTQVVEHSAETTAYPVVADPYAGIALFSNFSRGSWSGDYTYNAKVTTSGAVVLSGVNNGGYIAGQAIFRTYGWDEWKAIWGSQVTVKATVYQQYECHVTAGTAGLPFTGPYNLERARTDNPVWPIWVTIHHCNW